MVDTKISELPAATAIASPDVAPIVQGGVTKKADVSLFGKPPFTLNPSTVLAQDTSNVPILKINSDSILVFPVSTTMESPGTDIDIPNDSDLTIFWGANGGGSINANGVTGNLYLSSDSGDPDGSEFRFVTGDSNSGTDGNGGDMFIQPGLGAGSGRRGIVYIDSLIKLLPLDDPPSQVEEGMIYADTDHHLYYYNGTTWKQLDNVL